MAKPAIFRTYYTSTPSKCRFCGALIAWERNRNGKAYPVDVRAEERTAAGIYRERTITEYSYGLRDFHNCPNRVTAPRDEPTPLWDR